MKKTITLLASVVMSTTAFAQWVAPTVQTEEMKLGEVQYLYNVGAKGFFLGANDYGTRASVSKTKGYKVQIKKNWNEYMDDGVTPAEGATLIGYSINDSVETKKGWYDLFVNDDAEANMYVDRASQANYDNWMIEKKGDYYEITNQGSVSTIPSLVGMPLGIAEYYKGETGNTRLYLYDSSRTYKATENDEEVQKDCFSGEFYSNWAFVSPDAYTEYISLAEVYEAAVELGKYIEDAKVSAPELSLAAAQAVYDNYSSTKDELVAALEGAKLAMANFNASKATPDNPGDMTVRIVNNGFETGNLDGWTNSGEQKTQTQSNSSFDGKQGGYYCERWHVAGTFDMNQTLTEMPEGVYKLSAYAYDSESLANLRLYLNDTKSAQITTSGHYSLFANVEGTTDVKIGVTFTGTSNSWTCCDEFTLLYYGNALESYKFWWNDVKTNADADISALLAKNTAYDKTAFAAYSKALTDGEAATDKAAIISAVANLEEATAQLKASMTSYANLAKIADDLYKNIEAANYSSDISGYFTQLLSADNSDDANDAIEALEGEISEGDYFTIIKSSPKILCALDESEAYVEGVSCTLTAEQIDAYVTALQNLAAYVVANSLQDGQDCTSLLKDADFTDANGAGWTVGKLGAPGAWTGGIMPGCPVAEAWHKTFDIYQEIEVPNGIYSISLNGFCRPENGSAIKAEVYLNEFATPFQDIQLGGLAIDGSDAQFGEPKDGFNCYLTNGNSSAAITQNPIFQGNTHKSPNDAVDTSTDGVYAPNGMEGASVAFSAGRYKATAYGLVQDGKIKVGCRNSYNSDWVLWGNFKLVFEGKSLAALNSILPTFTNQLDKYLEDNSADLTTPVATAAATAVTDAKASIEAQDADAMFEALSAINKQLVAVKENNEALISLREWQGKVLAQITKFQSTMTEEASEASSKFDEGYEASGEATTEKLNELIEEAKVLMSLAAIPNTYTEATEAAPVDFTGTIINPTYEEGNNNGWPVSCTVNTTTLNAELYNCDPFDYYQEIAGLPAGYYIVGVQAFYRQGTAANDYAATVLHSEGTTEAYNVSLYATAGENSVETPICAVSAGVQATEALGTDGTVEVDHDMVVPNSMATGNTCFENGYYKNAIAIEVKQKGDVLRIGLKKTAKIETDWTLFDNWTLSYVGTTAPTAINEVANTNAVASEFFTVSGVRVSGLQKGINIVKMTDGSVKKVLVK